jgi:transcriptional regulator with XRE-family HTH domain
MGESEKLNTVEALGELLRDLRVSKGLNQGALAGLLGVDQSRVSVMERGGRWTIENLEQVAEALGMKGWELLRLAEGGDDTEATENPRIRLTREERALVAAVRRNDTSATLAALASALRKQHRRK